ncbi:NUDIX domain-containing protein [Micromonospora sp. NPDC048839]|uniref:NUDIX hydrolase n=1 Tax=Micromonospora sp. NPDC048839 TaxID=3155641 RepID=UPI0033C1D2FE
MPEKIVTQKALCYVVRNGLLLVFRHTNCSYEEVGVQVPGGTIRPGEAPENAALREAREETALTDFRVVRKLGESEYDISPHRFEIQRRHIFLMELLEPTPLRWSSREDHDGTQPPTPFECFWVPLTAGHVHGASSPARQPLSDQRNLGDVLVWARSHSRRTGASPR